MFKTFVNLQVAGIDSTQLSKGRQIDFFFKTSTFTITKAAIPQTN
jgi:hypothetical protein